MSLESFNYIDSLNASNPTTTDNVSEGDDHIRGIKTTIKNTFPNINAAVTATDEELNYVDGVTSNIQTQLGTKLPLAGGTMTGDVSLGTNVKAKFGASDDLQIYHDGSHSRIKDTGTGHLIIMADADVRITDTTGNETKASFITDGAVNLSHNGTNKLATTSTGIDVTGSVTCDGFTSTGIDDNATSTAITIDASKNVGIGVVPETWSLFNALQLGGNASLIYKNATLSDFSIANNVYYNSGWKYINTDQAARMVLNNEGKIVFQTAPSGTADTAISWTTAMTIDNNGHVFTPSGIHNGWGGKTTQNHTQIGMYHNGAGELWLTRGGADYIGRFGYQPTNTAVGSISISASSTSFNTSSDYRLKELDVPMEGSIDRLKLLRPINFAWKADGSRVDGFFAHEAQEVVPEAVTGTKDAMMDEEYEVTPAVMDGETVVTEAVMGTRSVPDYQGIDQSKLVPLLVASLQEAVAKIEALEARVTALEV